MTGHGTAALLLGLGLLAAACAPSPGDQSPGQTPASRVGLPAAGPSGACDGVGQAAAAASTRPRAAADADPGPLAVDLTPVDAGDLAQQVATDAIADPAVPGEVGSVPVVVTSVDAEGRPDIRQIVATDPSDAAGAVRSLAEDVVAAGDEVVAVTADRPVTAADVDVDSVASVPLAATNDPLRSWQWALDQVAYQSVWPRTNGTGVCVAVVDSGVQTTHPDLASRLVASKDFTGEGVAVAGDHGTHVAGIIAAVPDNGQGTVGAAPGVDLLNAKVLSGAGSGLESWVAAGITWSVDQGADVVNLSLGSACLVASPDACLSTTMRLAIDYARARDVVVVTSAGNNGATGSGWTSPAAYDGTIATASIAQSGSRSWFSTQASYVDVAAPGELIWSTIAANNGYGAMSGTSMAAPYVTAEVALVIAAHPTESAAQIRARVLDTARDAGAAGTDDEYGRGLIDPAAAVG